MEIFYLGTAAAEGYPGLFCNCPSCVYARKNLPLEMRTRSQVLIDGTLLVDLPPDTYLHAVRTGVDFSAVDTILVTHSHMDHFYPQELLNRGYKYARDMTSPHVTVYGNETVYEVYVEGLSRELRKEAADTISFRIVRPFEKFSVGKYTVLSLPAVHTTEEQSLLYAVSDGEKTILYLNDTGDLTEECCAFLAENDVQASLVSIDCTLADRESTSTSGRHMGFKKNAVVREKLAAYGIVSSGTICVTTHFSHNSDPRRDRMDRLAKEYGCTAAHDGMKITI